MSASLILAHHAGAWLSTIGALCKYRLQPHQLRVQLADHELNWEEVRVWPRRYLENPFLLLLFSSSYLFPSHVHIHTQTHMKDLAVNGGPNVQLIIVDRERALPFSLLQNRLVIGSALLVNSKSWSRTYRYFLNRNRMWRVRDERRKNGAFLYFITVVCGKGCGAIPFQIGTVIC